MKKAKPIKQKKGQPKRPYCVVYSVLGTHYRFRCFAENKQDAIRQCKKMMNPEKIVEAECDLSWE